MGDCFDCSCFSRNRNNGIAIRARHTEEMRPLISENNSHDTECLPRKDYESLDYNTCYNQPYERHAERINREHSSRKLEVLKWVVTFFVGLLTGLVALFIDSIVKQLAKLKLNIVGHSIQYCSNEGCLAVSLLYMLIFNVGFVFIASLLVVYLEPIAGGSGIPEIKCYLNGVKIPRVGRLRTLLAKSVGVLFSVAGGLFVGKEGPMIHSGAIIGAGVPQFQSIAFRKVNWKKYSFFRTDRDKRDFVSGGAAAGVAAAFGAPIGGVLFSLEEGCSFWNQALTWRTFFCSMAATYSLNFFLSGLDSKSWGYFYLPGLINFGVFKCSNEAGLGCRLWDIVDLFAFIIMAIVGGLLGSLFNLLNEKLTLHRMRHVHTKSKIVKILESMLVASITTSGAFVLSLTLGKCKEFPKHMLNSTSAVSVENSTRAFFCDPGYYNDLSTLFFNSQEDAIKQLFHEPKTDAFSLPSLGLFFIFFFLMSCWTYGCSVPSGLFVPSLLCGATYGRFVAHLMVKIGYSSHAVHSGTFALVGAAAFLGGVVRMTISLTVILIESTNEISYGLPLMLVLMVAKWSGDLFNEGLYDIHIKLRGVPFLEWEAPSFTSSLKARDVMKRTLHFIYPVTRVKSLIQILKTTAHNAFPVVTVDNHVRQAPASNANSGEDDLLASMDEQTVTYHLNGIILRSQLVVLLKLGLTKDSPEHQNSNVSYEELTQDYPRYPDIYDVISAARYTDSQMVDVVPYMNPSPFTVYPDTPLPQVFSLFRSMGLRHLPVVSHSGSVLGMITRHDLTHECLESCLEHREA